MRSVPHLIISFPPPICKTHTLHRNGTTAILNVFLRTSLDTIRLEVIRTIGGLSAVEREKNTKVKTRIKTGVYQNHGPITTSMTAVDGEYKSARNIADTADTTVTKKATKTMEDFRPTMEVVRASTSTVEQSVALGAPETTAAPAHHTNKNEADDTSAASFYKTKLESAPQVSVMLQVGTRDLWSQMASSRIDVWVPWYAHPRLHAMRNPPRFTRIIVGYWCTFVFFHVLLDTNSNSHHRPFIYRTPPSAHYQTHTHTHTHTQVGNAVSATSLNKKTANSDRTFGFMIKTDLFEETKKEMSKDRHTRSLTKKAVPAKLGVANTDNTAFVPKDVADTIAASSYKIKLESAAQVSVIVWWYLQLRRGLG